MLRRFSGLVVSLSLLATSSFAAATGAAPAKPRSVVCDQNASFAERLAAKEIRRYLYLRTGVALPIVDRLPAEPAIVVGVKGSPLVAGLLSDAKLQEAVAGLKAEEYVLRTVAAPPAVLVIGGDPVGTLYGAYRLAEQLGVRFYMHGDVVPDERMTLAGLPVLIETGKPLFDRRGIQPFHDFPEGPDWWGAEQYKAILGQLPKMRMNFFGLHTYPPGGVGPEPLVWIGTAGEIGETPPSPPAPLPKGEGRIMASYPSRHFTTSNITGAWGYRPMKTSDYLFGAVALYDRDDFGADYMEGTFPWNKMSPEQCNALFDRMGDVLREGFTLARRLGIKTCVGTETPLLMPAAVQTRLKAAGKNPASLAAVQAVYEGMFARIAKTHPLDYYWFWTPEGWTWSAVSQPQIDTTLSDLRAAMAAAEKVKAPFTLATCGWVLGPPQQPSLFDNVLPKTMPMSCISRTVGNSPVEPGFARVEGRPKWSIPWMEDDPGMILPQLWVGRMRRDAADSHEYGCTGLMGIHWRTRILGPNVSALAKAAWEERVGIPALAGGAGHAQPAEAGTPTRPAEGVEGGQVAHFQQPIAGTSDAPLYQSVRYDMRAYRINVHNGTYTVTLKFCEPAYREKGKRVFGVKLQGKPVIDSLDIFEKAGPDKALDYTFKDVQVTGGQLVVEFVHQVEYPCIAAIAIEGPVTRKINCGGGAYKDYVADLPVIGAGGRPRYLPSDDFYADWAAAEFGPAAAGPTAAIFARIDCHLPRPGDWTDGPGGVKPDGRPWAEVSQAYAFVDELAALRSQVKGAGNLERFDYWLNNFRYMRGIAQVNCTWARFNAAMQRVRAEKDAVARKKLAREVALPIRKELVAQAAEMHGYLMATVTTYGELGNVTNWQQHNFPGLLIGPGQELAKILGEDLPADALPLKQHRGEPRLIVPTVRTALVAGEPLRLTVIAAGLDPTEAAVYWRPLGDTGDFSKVPLTHVARGVYAVTLPGEATKADLEYYVHVTADGGKPLVWPPTAPTLCQSVVIVE